MTDFYASIILQGPSAVDVLAVMNEMRQIAYIAPAQGDCVVLFHEDFAAQEDIAANLSSRLQCPALLAMVFGGTILLYHLYVNGQRLDDYVSTPHEGLDLDGPTPPGDATALCAAFGVEHRAASVERILRRPTRANTDYALAVNRHGELLRALKLPLFAAGAGFNAIEAGELPLGPGFDPSTLVRTGV